MAQVDQPVADAGSNTHTLVHAFVSSRLDGCKSTRWC